MLVLMLHFSTKERSCTASNRNHATLTVMACECSRAAIYGHILFEASPEYTRYRKRFYMYIYLYVHVCLWGDHFSEERVKFWTCKVMVVMRIRPHCTIDLRDNSSVGKANWKGELSAVPLWQGSGPRLTSLVLDSTFLSMKMTAWRLILSGPGYRYLDSWSWHVDY